MPVYLVRHAKAGSRSTWEGDDKARPLTESGKAQSIALSLQLAREFPSVLLSSPYVRCVQTLEPLSMLCELPIVLETRIAEESPLELSLAALEAAPDNAVLCSHGDVIPDVIHGLMRRGMTVDEGSPSPKKGSVYVLHRVRRIYVRAEYWEAPDV